MELSKQAVVLFWGKNSVYSACPGWPKVRDMILIADSIRKDAKAFFDDLLSATIGFYFLEADADRDLTFLRAYNYRNQTAKGINLLLAAPF